ncbi:MAG: glucuronate isomerase [Candidatus Hydrogenedentota bacterium]
MPLLTDEAVRAAVYRIVRETSVLDMHAHLYDPAFGDLLLWGIDELLTYHYLIAEVLRVAPISPSEFYELSKQAQAELIWREMFVERAPLSEACRGVATVLHKLGLEPGRPNLDEYRAWFAEQSATGYVDLVFERSNVSAVVMTNDPFDDWERPFWERGFDRDPRFHAALRIDRLLNDWSSVRSRLSRWDYDVSPHLTPPTLREIRRFLEDWLDRMDARYMAVSLPPDFRYPDPESPRGIILDTCVLPAAQSRGVPFALMVGVTRQVNPALGPASDGVAPAGLGPLINLCADHPENRFFATYLAREDQHGLCVAARKFPNLMPFGCWWFLNNPSLIEEMTRMRVELLGTSFIPQHSDARVLDQLLYKWDHSREVIARVLADKYAALHASGWPVTDDVIRRDVAAYFQTNFNAFATGSSIQ